MNTQWCRVLTCVVGLLPVFASPAAADEKLSVAIFPFQSTIPGSEGVGAQIADLCAVFLAQNEAFVLVEREKVNAAISELELSLSALADQSQALRVGKLVSAKLLVFGKLFELGDEVFAVARIIGTETTRMQAVKAQIAVDGSLSALAEDVTIRILAAIEERGASLVAQREPAETPLSERLARRLEGQPRMRVLVSVRETHRAMPGIDPAAESELMLALKAQGFPVVDQNSAPAAAWLSEYRQDRRRATRAGGGFDVAVLGEAISEFGLRQGNLVSCRARVELKAVDVATGEVLAVAHHSVGAVDLSESLAGKTAIQKGAAMLIEDFVSELVKSWVTAHPQEAQKLLPDAKPKALAGSDEEF